MKVKEIMTSNPITCSSGDNLDAAAMRMWDRDCGFLPVVDDGRLEGVLSMNDIILAAGKSPGEEHRPTYREVVGAMHGICEHRHVS